jgi:hypothetical protein
MSKGKVAKAVETTTSCNSCKFHKVEYTETGVHESPIRHTTVRVSSICTKIGRPTSLYWVQEIPDWCPLPTIVYIEDEKGKSITN